MIGAYNSLMQNAGDMIGQGGQQAIPVHHIGKGTIDKPEAGSMKAQAMGFLKEVEDEMTKYNPGSRAYQRLMGIRGEIINGIADMDVEHQTLQEGYTGIAPIDQRAQDVMGRMVPYRRGVTPEGKPVR